MPVDVDERPANAGTFPAQDHFPLGRRFGLVDVEPEPASAVRPFGLTLAQPPQWIERLNPDEFGYDSDTDHTED